MESRALLENIPKGKFHSVIMTTFSLNLYYLEEQVIPLLNQKEINYISVLADARMLSEQLAKFAVFSDRKKRNYSLHGIDSKGSFHPKIIFLAGDNEILILLGSGNLSLCGHGRNLESWNAVHAGDQHSEYAVLTLEIWQYLKNILLELGACAAQIVFNIEQNCAAIKNLNESPKPNLQKELFFVSNSKEQAIFPRLKDILIEKKVNEITIASPYYDTKGDFITLLDKTFNPKQINIILQEGFGSFPSKMKINHKINFYNWSNQKNKKFNPNFFHTKQIQFSCDEDHYLISGSANASMAAFGSEIFREQNYEACLLYRKPGFDLLDEMGIDPKDVVRMEDLKEPKQEEYDAEYQRSYLTFITAAERQLDCLTIFTQSTCGYPLVKIIIYDQRAEILHSETRYLQEGKAKMAIILPKAKAFYVEIHINNSLSSNSQFITDIDSFEDTSPNPENRQFQKIRQLIGTEDFASEKIIDYLYTLQKERENREKIASTQVASTVENSGRTISEKESNSSYEEAIKLADLSFHETEFKDPHYRYNELWEALFSYRREMFDDQQEKQMDEEETENVNESLGRKTGKSKAKNLEVKSSDIEKMRRKMEKFLTSYQELLERKANDSKEHPPKLSDISVLLILIQILLQISLKKYQKAGSIYEETVLPLPFDAKKPNWSVYVLTILGSFSLWAKKSGFKIKSNETQFNKLLAYSRNLYSSTIALMAVYRHINESLSPDTTEHYININLLNIIYIFSTDDTPPPSFEEVSQVSPEALQSDEFTAILEQEINHLRQIISASPNSDDYYFHPHDGWCLILRKIINKKNPQKPLLKLANIGYGDRYSNNNFSNQTAIDPDTLYKYSL